MCFFKYLSNCVWTDSAPFRTITVKDAMCDLPDIKNGWSKEEMPYGSEPLSHFQRKVTTLRKSILIHFWKQLLEFI